MEVKRKDGEAAVQPSLGRFQPLNPANARRLAEEQRLVLGYHELDGLAELD